MTHETSHASKTTDLHDVANTVQSVGSHMLKSAGQAYGATRNLADTSLDQAQRFARRSLDAASDAGAKAQKTLSRYADNTGEYVANQPMKSMLISAAAGAVIAALFFSARRRNDR
ncbi:MAG: hypothetical protein ABI135_09845 [Rhodoferax sp.]